MTQRAIHVGFNVRSGVPVIQGTRFPVARLLAELSEGASVEAIAAEYGLPADACRNAIREIAGQLNCPDLTANPPTPAAATAPAPAL